MRAILKLALKELKKKKLFSLLMFGVCLLAMHMILTSITNVTSAVYQQKVFESSLGYEMENVLHLDYHYTEENNDFADVLSHYRDYIAGLPGVEAVGQFDVTGMFFSELRIMNSYLEINSEIVSDGKYATHPEITQLLSVDEELLHIVKGGISEYAEMTSGNLPIYASEAFKDILPVGTFLTDERTGDVYEVAGYFSRESKWLDENDLIRFPMDSMDGWFIAPFSDESERDIMTQLSCLHNTYVVISDDADIEYLKGAIADYSIQHNFEATANTLAEEYEMYSSEIEPFIIKQIGLAVFISAMAISSIIAVFTTNALLKRRQYGIFIANGLTLTDIVVCIATEIAIIIGCTMLLAWSMKLVELKVGTDLFRDILIIAHIQFTLPTCLIIGVLLVGAATIIPAFKVFQYQPNELIGGNTNGNY